MRFFNIFTVTFLMTFALSVHGQEDKTANYYGANFQLEPEVKSEMSIIEQLVSQDTVQTQLKGKIKDVCQVKGCWMQVVLDNDEEVFVRFKDYGFFVPTDSSNKNVVINGSIFTTEISVEEQKHYAKDGGASSEEVAKIVSPKKQLRFEADGVLIRE